MRKWTKLGFGLGALVLAVAAGSVAFALYGDDGGGSNGDQAANERQANPEADEDSASGDSLGMCAPGVTDCVDVVVDPAGACLEGSTEECYDNPGAAGGTCLAGSTEECADNPGIDGGAAGICIEGTVDCVDTPLGAPADCAPDVVDCGDDAPMVKAVYCEPGQSINDCFPDGVPAGYDCVTLESEPIQVECFIVEDGGSDPCGSEPDANVRCLPPECSVSSDGSVACPGSEGELVDPVEGQSGAGVDSEPAIDGGAIEPLPAQEQ